jgi:hypothetical protein
MRVFIGVSVRAFLLVVGLDLPVQSSGLRACLRRGECACVVSICVVLCNLKKSLYLKLSLFILFYKIKNNKSMFHQLLFFCREATWRSLLIFEQGHIIH